MAVHHPSSSHHTCLTNSFIFRKCILDSIVIYRRSRCVGQGDCFASREELKLSKPCVAFWSVIACLYVSECLNWTLPQYLRGLVRPEV